ncbi:memo-like protein [Microdochium trichocladiopsis]|uniref:Memo-like protein n=1 Tax=Microdochium trichocladiopsis TaxID=1682393 RepID=A0A9P9BNV1_9PEZI|nr:memo-like protein [Microdochium trichocladiopsis]KAH7027834.1 memo-like protein [Microdochium trichocladiopsis]
MADRDTRSASHAGGRDDWYMADPAGLNQMLDAFLNDVRGPFTGVQGSFADETLPIPGARIVIAPHAGYNYSGKWAAWAYRTLDLSKARRVFVLGPSHTYGFRGAALTTFARYATPLGDLVVDEPTVAELRGTGKFTDIPRTNDVREHSLEMHLPYLYKQIAATFESPSSYPTIVPILVGNNKLAEEQLFGRLLAPYLAQPDTVFVVSSDFCHWGDHFDYKPYTRNEDCSDIRQLGYRDSAPSNPTIHESIAYIDKQAMRYIEAGDHAGFVANLAETENTVCGRHPIGVALAALERLSLEAGTTQGDRFRFKFVCYARSKDITKVNDSSVSYASAYAVL